MGRLLSVARCRCPHCQKGEIFSGFWQMHRNCPVCGVLFERETGYFMNAIFIGYVIGFVLLVPLLVTLYLLQASPLVFSLTVSAVLLLLAPLIFRYARVIWMHLDELMDPRR